MSCSDVRRRPSRPALGCAALALVLAVAGPLGFSPAAARTVAGHATITDPATAAAGHQGMRPVPGRLVRGFDAPLQPFGRGHRGVDLLAAPGDVVRAARHGRVTFAGEVAGTGWVTLDHAGGIVTTYGGVVPVVRDGARVAAGAPIARLATGRAVLDWGARWRPGGRQAYFDPLLLLADLRPRLVAPVGERRADRPRER
jgi:murein DD-endopeptidase MepM/ murein hydrolase activator NlpD